MKITIGTRGSALALWQARFVARALREAHPDVEVNLLTIKTTGDKIIDSPLAQIGGKGLFTKEIEEALLEKRVDLAVHSMKDLPTELPQGLHVAAVMKREDPRDVFISRDGRQLGELGPGERIGTSSLRRKAFLLNKFPQLEIVSIRGNVDTRLRKIETENLAGVILAAAGIIRLGFAERVTAYLEPELLIPAIGQGALAIESRVSDESTNSVLLPLNDPNTSVCVSIERAFLRRMGGGCQVPMAAHCTVNDGHVRVLAAVVHPDGNPMLREDLTSTDANPEQGVKLADSLIGKGAEAILRDVLANDWEPGPASDIV